MITQNDLVILKHEVMADTPDGGGLVTDIPVVDGVSNNLFPDVSDIDRLMGRVRLRKVSLAVKTANADLLQAARLLFTELPDNDNLSVFAFKATSPVDRRSDAQNKIESYLAFGTRWAGHLLETQLEGQSIIQQVVRNGDPLPAVGQPLALVQNEGQPDEFYQYVRVTKVTSQERTFTVGGNSVVRTIANIEISEPLRYKFDGITVDDFERNNYNKLRVAYLREGRVADAARYYSASKLAQPVTALASRQVMLNSVFVQVVPSTQAETPLAQVDPAMQQSALVKASSATLSYSVSANVAPNTKLYLGSSMYPGTISFTLNGKAITDVAGELKDSANVVYGSVDYALGLITWSSNASFGQQTLSITFLPAGTLTQLGNTDVIQVPELDAGYNYIRTLQAPPVPTTLTVSYQAGGRVYTLKDDGRGKLFATDGTSAAGTIDYDGALMTLTTAAIPDGKSLIVISYGIAVNTYAYQNSTAKKAAVVIPIPDKSIDAASLTITWDGKTATANQYGNITGDATGDIAAGVITLRPNTLPAKGTAFAISYKVGEVKTEAITATPANNSVTFTLAGTGTITAGSIVFESQMTFENLLPAAMGTMTIKDDAQGNLVVASFNYQGTRAYDSFVVGKKVGTVNYTSRQITLNPQISATQTIIRVNAPGMAFA